VLTVSAQFHCAENRENASRSHRANTGCFRPQNGMTEPRDARVATDTSHSAARSNSQRWPN
jgi:hypothetical protein